MNNYRFEFILIGRLLSESTWTWHKKIIKEYPKWKTELMQTLIDDWETLGNQWITTPTSSQLEWPHFKRISNQEKMKKENKNRGNTLLPTPESWHPWPPELSPTKMQTLEESALPNGSEEETKTGHYLEPEKLNQIPLWLFPCHLVAGLFHLVHSFILFFPANEMSVFVEE